MKAIIEFLRDAVARARLERLLGELDERTLRDIGFEAEANRRRDAARLPHLGMY
jgi:hypothetical protein